ncbi:hypothetical protein OH76DRAFT_804600 [Lentinus brumalis]|uniref:Uncharacterized protein n=1 Tax=Lentinus brumalis TaxID=2498619 RepID=A0A371D2Q3_9APHY|nr:hypothetical protein OH76DRAFT_804600 [Polyporus brumalis]
MARLRSRLPVSLSGNFAHQPMSPTMRHRHGARPAAATGDARVLRATGRGPPAWTPRTLRDRRVPARDPATPSYASANQHQTRTQPAGQFSSSSTFPPRFPYPASFTWRCVSRGSPRFVKRSCFKVLASWQCGTTYVCTTYSRVSRTFARLHDGPPLAKPRCKSSRNLACAPRAPLGSSAGSSVPHVRHGSAGSYLVEIQLEAPEQ